MAYSVYSYGSQYAETGQVGIYVGTREDNLAECLAVDRGRAPRRRGGNLRAGELERAKENLEGRMLLSLESTSNRMTRLGKALVTDTSSCPSRRRSAASRRSTPRTSPRLAASSSPRRASRRRGSDRARAGSAPPSARVNPALERPSVKVCALRRRGKVGSVLGAGLEHAGHEVVDARAAGPADATSRSTSPGPTRSRQRRACARSAACRSWSGRAGFDQEVLDRPRARPESRASTPRTSRSEQC